MAYLGGNDKKKKGAEMSLELGTFDIDNLVGDIINEDKNGIDAALGIPPKDSDSDDIDENLNKKTHKPSKHKTKIATSDDDLLNAIPAKDSDDDDGSYKPPIQSNLGGGGNFKHKQLPSHDDDDDDMGLTPQQNKNNAAAISMDMDNFNINDIAPFGDDQKINNDDYDNKYNGDDNKNNDGNVHGNFERENLLDETVMKLLHPDYYQEINKQTRRDQLRKHTPAIQYWSEKDVDKCLINPAEKMSQIEQVAMYDSLFYPSMMDDKNPKKTASYELVGCDLVEISSIPVKFFGGVNDDAGLLDNGDGRNNTMLDYLKSDDNQSFGASSTLKMVGNVGGALLGTQQAKSSVVCNACGVSLKFRAKKRLKYNYMGFKCIKTGKEYIFHDYLCVKLRKIKEAIKNYVFKEEKEEKTKHGKVEEENLLINIDKQVQVKENHRCRPSHRTTPKKGDHNYDKVEEEREESYSSTARGGRGYSIDYDYSDHETDDEGSVNTGGLSSPNSLHNKNDKKNKKKNKQIGFVMGDDVDIPKHLHFRRYRCHVTRTLARMEPPEEPDNITKKQKQSMKVRKNKLISDYDDRFGELPDILLYCDLNEFGIAIWEFVSESLKSKMRDSLWHILEWLALEMPTNSVLHLLKRNTHLLNKNYLDRYDTICKATMEGSKFPIACTLRLSAFMYERAEIDLSNQEDFRNKGEQYVTVARRLAADIESDHLFALLLMIPTDIGHQNVIEIALKYDLTYFLEDPRIVRVFAVIWYNGYDFLDPDNSFSEPEQSVDILFEKLMFAPGRFYFSPYGKFCISALLYLGYLGLFSYVTYMRVYDYTLGFSTLEGILWFCSIGYVTFEVLEFIDAPTEYFSSFVNYWDVLIAVNWIILAYLRINPNKEYVYDQSGQLDEAATRNTLSTELYMGFWAFQCIILWTRVASIFKVSQRAGPLIRMIMNMLSDVANFFLIWALFFIGGALAAYYVIGGDLQSVEGRALGSLPSVLSFIFKTLIGQPDWDKVNSYTNDEGIVIFNSDRSNMIIWLLLFYSIFGTILLLNLLIAMMASSYEAVKEKALQELNKQKIDTYYDLDKSRGIIAPPFNILAYLFYVYWFAFELVTWLLTFGHRQFNEEYFSPLNKGSKQYTKGDIIKFRKGTKELSGECLSKTAKSLRSTAHIKHGLGRTSVVGVGANAKDQSIANDSFITDLVVEHNGLQHNLTDKDIIKISKTFFKKRKTRIPTLGIENVFCRFCRYNITNDSMSIDYYLSLFELRGQHIDPDDKKYMRSLLSPVSPEGIPHPVTCKLCPNCYRPYKITRSSGEDVLSRMMFILEIVSYIVFWWTFRWVIALALFLPAAIVKLIKFIIRKSHAILTGQSNNNRSTKSIMNTSEENDDYRAQVRQVSKQEEKTDDIVRRIDANVQRLQSELVGSTNDEDQEMDDTVHTLRSDEFDEEVKEMKKEMFGKFQEIKNLLSQSGYQQSDYQD